MQSLWPEPAVQAGAIEPSTHLKPIASALHVASRLICGGRGLLEGVTAEAHVSILEGEEVITLIQAPPATALDCILLRPAPFCEFEFESALFI